MTIILVIGLLTFLFFVHERPSEPGIWDKGAPHGLEGPVMQDCGLNMTCFREAISGECRAVTFVLPHPFNNTKFLDGAVIGRVINKCKVRVEDPETGKSMDCLLDESLFSSIDSLRDLRTACSGELLKEIQA